MGTLEIPWPPGLINEKTAAAKLGVTPMALNSRRLRGTAPPHVRCPCGCRQILYDVRTLEERPARDRK